MTASPSDVLEIRPFRPEMADDLAELFATDASANACWCMWFITSVTDFHTAGPEGNRAAFEALARTSDEPMGLLAYRGGRLVGWCAVGPKARFERAVRTPTLRGHVGSPRPTWFVPCFFVRAEARRTGVTRQLLACAVAMASEHGAELVEGFPTAGPRPASSGDRQVGPEGVFAELGFEPVHRPSAKRVVMQRATGGGDAAAPDGAVSSRP